jgi:hypothetical protein
MVRASNRHHPLPDQRPPSSSTLAPIAVAHATLLAAHPPAPGDPVPRWPGFYTYPSYAKQRWSQTTKRVVYHRWCSRHSHPRRKSDPRHPASPARNSHAPSHQSHHMKSRTCSVDSRGFPRSSAKPRAVHPAGCTRGGPSLPLLHSSTLQMVTRPSSFLTTRPVDGGCRVSVLYSQPGGFVMAGGEDLGGGAQFC